jgi:ATP phosphoribosyltransferase
MSGLKSLSECTISELKERKSKHEFLIKMIDSELEKRKGKTNNVLISIKTKNNDIKKDDKKSPPKKSPTKETTIDATRDDMKVILSQKNIKFASNSTKSELYEIIKKNNLIRNVENYHKALKVAKMKS